MIVADAGPLIALARIQRLSLLQQLYGEVLIPAAVQRELQLDTPRPGAQALIQAIGAGWLRAQTVGDTTELTALSRPLDAGEAEAILLAEQVTCQFLLIDDWQGRTVAKVSVHPLPLTPSHEGRGNRLSSCVAIAPSPLVGEG